MPRLMSFALTTRQFLDRSKTVTRRTRWLNLEPGVLLCGVEKAMGLKKGEKVVTLGLIRVVDVRRERLDEITQAECVREGFPEMSPTEFVEMFCAANRCAPGDDVTRIEFEHVDPVTWEQLQLVEAAAR